MTPQTEANLALQHWQSLRHLTPEERIEALIRDFFAPFVSEQEYLETLDRVSREMVDA